MRSLPALLGFILLAACSSIDKRALTNFNPQGSTGFVYTAQYGELFLANDKGAEAQRLGWLDQYVKSNGLCPNGYRIVSRTKEPTNDVMGTLVYKGVCT